MSTDPKAPANPAARRPAATQGDEDLHLPEDHLHLAHPGHGHHLLRRDGRQPQPHDRPHQAHRLPAPLRTSRPRRPAPRPTPPTARTRPIAETAPPTLLQPAERDGHPVRHRVLLQPAHHEHRLPALHHHRHRPAGGGAHVLPPVAERVVRPAAAAGGVPGRDLRRGQLGLLRADRGGHRASTSRSSGSRATSITGRSCPTRSSTTTARSATWSGSPPPT